ncbi:MAG: CDP-alcohol phosphatidyltransferase family protein [Myxococcota bacterium]|nr:CDP-alcohol phosphatidyltransferase family protein [Myxococcota bacterium]
MPAIPHRLLLAAAGAALASTLLGLWLAPPGLPLSALALSALGGIAVPIGGFGLAWPERSSAAMNAANAVTLARASLGSVAGSVGVWAFWTAPEPRTLWLVLALGTLALALDGVDGAIARRTNSASAFGGRLDMESDGTFTAALCLLAWSSGAAGPWILLSGALRPLFILAGKALPWMNAPLYPSQRRRVVCVLQIASLLLALAPPLAPVSAWIAGLGLATLLYSFGRDTLWLYRERP